MRALCFGSLRGRIVPVRSPELLLDYMRRFIGFGAPHARTWFIGLEQGGGEDLDELERRLDAWSQSGATTFADLAEHCRRIGDNRWHGERARIQPTLGSLVRMMLASQGIVPTPDAVRRYQSAHFGSAKGETVIAELMPLPSRSITDWIYSESGVPGLETRESYLRTYRPMRVELLREAIRRAAPRSVVFLGLTGAATWAEIAGASFTRGPAGADWVTVGPTRFVIVKHPVAFGARNSYFEEIGRVLAP
jgi:hypothetical protein